MAATAPPPRYESEFHDDLLTTWRAQGFPADRTIQDVFGFESYESAPVEWRPPGRKKVVPEDDRDFAAFRKTYDPERRDLLPRGWASLAWEWSRRDRALCISPWDEGILQVLGVEDWPTLRRALVLLCETPGRVEGVMGHYGGHLERLLDRVLEKVRPDFAFFYEPIASNHGPVISAESYRRFAVPALRRVVERLERAGIRYRVLWTSGRVHSLIPVWIEAGVNGLHITQTRGSGISYRDLRREYGAELRLVGGVPWEALADGESAINEALEGVVRPLLEEGGYIPHVDDRIRPQIPFENFLHYRRRLDALVAEIYAAGK